MLPSNAVILLVGRLEPQTQFLSSAQILSSYLFLLEWALIVSILQEIYSFNLLEWMEKIWSGIFHNVLIAVEYMITLSR